MSRDRHEKRKAHDEPAQQPSRDVDQLQETVKQLESQLHELNDELAKTKDISLRQLADMDNTRKRLQREKGESVQFAAEGLIRNGFLALFAIVSQPTGGRSTILAGPIWRPTNRSKTAIMEEKCYAEPGVKRLYIDAVRRSIRGNAR